MPTFPVGDTSYLAAARRCREELAEQVRRDAELKAVVHSLRVAMEYLEPIARIPTRARGGYIPDPPKSCDCGHLYSVHDSTPGVGCTHRPYCLCVHPTGQQVPVVRVSLAPPNQADPGLIVRSVR